MKVADEIYAGHQGLDLCNSSESALSGADALIIMTEWKQFKTPDFNLIKRSLNYPVIFDGRNIYNLDKVNNIGIAILVSDDSPLQLIRTSICGF
jgi:UDPglucose 6-dehydrogenase